MRVPEDATGYKAAVNDELLRFLEMARRELGGVDARAEIGGRAPESGDTVVCEISEDSRIVVVLGSETGDSSLLSVKLERLVETFLRDMPPPSVGQVRGTQDPTQHGRLRQALEDLVERAGARVAAVLDQTSPIIWGSTLAQDSDGNVDTLIASAEDVSLNAASDAQLIGKAAAALRSAGGSGGDGPLSQQGASVLLRRFAGIYALVVGYDAQASPLRVESAARKALGHIEQIVLALPPLDPEPGGKKILKFKRPFRVIR